RDQLRIEAGDRVEAAIALAPRRLRALDVAQRRHAGVAAGDLVERALAGRLLDAALRFHLPAHLGRRIEAAQRAETGGALAHRRVGAGDAIAGLFAVVAAGGAVERRDAFGLRQIVAGRHEPAHIGRRVPA